MTSSLLTGLAVIGVAAGAAAVPAAADDTGFAYMHDLRGRCFADHYHYGSGTGPNKNAAMRDAVASWASFTAMEYGSDWARWGRAAGKAGSCSRDSSGFSCSISARPCK